MTISSEFKGARSTACADAFKEAPRHLLAEIDTRIQQKVEEALKSVPALPAGEVHVLNVQQALAEPLPDAAIASYPGNVGEEDRKQHPTSVKRWKYLSPQVRARFQGPDVQAMFSKVGYRPQVPIASYVTSEGEILSLFREVQNRNNFALQAGGFDVIVTSAPAPLRPLRLRTDQTNKQDKAEVSSGRDLPDVGSMSYPAVTGHPLQFTAELKSPFWLQLKHRSAHELVDIWNDVVAKRNTGMSLDAAIVMDAKQRKLGVAVVRNVVHCLGQCYKYMAQRGHRYGALSDYFYTWFLNADRKGGLLVGDAIRHDQRGSAHQVSMSEAFCYCVLASFEETARGRQQPFLAAEEPGQAPRTSARGATEETHPSAGNEPPADPAQGAQAAGLCSDDGCEPAAPTGQPPGERSLGDLHLRACLARQTFLAMLDGQKVVIRMAFQPKHHKSVFAEVSALTTLHPYQGTHVPRLLDHGITSEGYAYISTEFIQGRAWRPESAADRALGGQLRAILALFLERGLLHRDIKPENIMVEEGTGRPVFVDFALARQAVDDFDFENEESELEAMLGQAEPDYEASLAHYQSRMVALQEAFMAQSAARAAHAPDSNLLAAPPAMAEKHARQEVKLSAWRSRRASRRTPSRLTPPPPPPSILRIRQSLQVLRPV
ncbi:hypothetical protein WJX74_001297 [Apatococcus lobatus]|uniref:Protein kinase domain-containing protein n=1 Tax=Apatococcus lobatus TaxID=904363 RepID=A0AAW1RF06_9CHLO